MSRKAALILGGVAALAVTAFAQFGPFGGSVPKQMVIMAPTRPLAVAAGSRATAELLFRVTKGLHVNSNKPTSELLIPTSLTLEAPAGIKVEEIAYPPGKDMSFEFAPEEKLNVYEGDFILRARLSVPAAVKPGSYKIAGEMKYQACSDTVCFPPKKMPVDFEVRVSR